MKNGCWLYGTLLWLFVILRFVTPSPEGYCETDPPQQRQEQEQEQQDICENVIVDSSDLEMYQRDGFIVKKNLLDDDLIEELCEVGKVIADGSQKFPSFFSVVERGVIFDGGISGLVLQDKEKNVSTEFITNATKAFRNVAIHSKIPQFAAQLMRLNPQTQNMRILRDLFLSKGLDVIPCDWHVDDQGFWPESFLSAASEESGIDQDGVNVWIALDDMPIEYQGSMALSAGSHRVPWRFEAYEALSQDRTLDGGSSKEDIMQRMEEKRKSGTANLGACAIAQTRPDLREQLEKRKVILDVQKGDIIFATRSLFHRTTDVTAAGRSYYTSHDIQALNRYSIRYTPGTAKLPNGWVAEWSAVSDSGNTGKSLDDIVTNGNILWYPKVWPEIDEDIENRLDFVTAYELERTKAKTQTEIIEMFTPRTDSSE